MHPRLGRLIVGLVTVVLLGAAGGSAGAVPDGPRAAEPPGLAVTAYALGSVAPDVVAASAPGLRTLTVDGVTLRRGSVTAPSAQVRALVGTAHAQGLRAELLVSNYSDELGDFDPAAARRLLADPARIDRVASSLAATVAAGGWDGINVDLESLSRADGPGLVALVRALRARMPAPLNLSIDVQAATSVRGYVRAGYRLPEIAASVDVVQLMAYDLHGPGWSGPGPIGPLRWQRLSLQALLSRVPAANVDLGVAGYGYTWPARGTGSTVSVTRARKLAAHAGVEPRWHPGSGEWSARIGTTALWWSDGRSFALRRQLASELGLHGLALWRLGSTDPVSPPA